MDKFIHTSTLTSRFSDRVSSLLSAKTISISDAKKQEILESLQPTFSVRIWHFILKSIQKRPFFYSLLALFGVMTFPAHAAHADGTWQDFEATAYYSPIKGQQNYYRGSYEADIRLNGKGTHGADGTPVYAGMIAAPRGYDFGTYIYFEGLGLTRVHDRGGAIKVSKDGTHNDRIDIWMGHGDAALERTKQWGRRNIRGKIVTDPSLYQFLNLNTINFNIGNPTKKAEENTTLGLVPLEKFAEIGYVPQGDDIEVMVLKFQLDYKVVTSKEAHGAGYYGPKTRAKFAEVYKNRAKIQPTKSTEAKDTDTKTLTEKHKKYTAIKDKVDDFKTGSMGDTSDGINLLQQFLVNKGYFSGKVDGVMDLEVLKSLRQYQHKNNLIQTGRLDMRTRLVMEKDI